ncbi:heavy-metal-associated domain-containing protein [Flavobacterium faecale]|uniref:heavy-metal-associated domain-containing protein n=1 Tax=Flavobacterium faecale TaxID=1355330 RepID=UPI003AAD6FCF
MSLLSNNIIPGNHGRVFGTDAKEDTDLEAIRKSILEIEGISEVAINNQVFPRELTIYSTKIINIQEVETKVKSVGFHAIPTDD